MKVRRFMRTRAILPLLHNMGYDVSLRTLQMWCKQGRVPAKKCLGGEWLIDLGQLKVSNDNGGTDLYEELVQSVNREAG